MATIAVDLGCGRSRRNHFQADVCIGVDPHATAFQDPTHVNIITEETVFYFCRKPDLDQHSTGNADLLLQHGQNYGFSGRFNLVDQRWRGAHLLWTLKKP